MRFLELKQLKVGSGKVYNSKTKECYDGKTYTIVEGCFRAYNSLAESVSDYFDLICKSSRYRKALVSETPKECITEIKKGGYATDPKYVDSIMKIIETNNLTIYDKREKEESKKTFKVNEKYKLLVNLYVRAGVGTNQRIKKYSELTKDGKKHALNQAKAVLKKGTLVTCKNVVKITNETWLEIPSGYICAIYNGKEYVK